MAQLISKTKLKGLRLKSNRKGVLSKEGTPFAAGTLFVSSVAGFKSPIDYTMDNMIRVLFDESVAEVQLIDLENNEYILEIQR